jgi:hypothetical protein
VEAIVQLEGFIIRRGFYESPRRIQRGIDPVPAYNARLVGNSSRFKTASGGLNHCIGIIENLKAFFVFLITGTTSTFSNIIDDWLFVFFQIKKINNRLASTALYNMMGEDFYNTMRA